MGFKETYRPLVVDLSKELGTWAKEHKLAAAGGGLFIGLSLLGAIAPLIDDDIDPSGQRGSGEAEDIDLSTPTPDDLVGLEVPLESGQVIAIK